MRRFELIHVLRLIFLLFWIQEDLFSGMLWYFWQSTNILYISMLIQDAKLIFAQLIDLLWCVRSVFIWRGHSSGDFHCTGNWSLNQFDLVKCYICHWTPLVLLVSIKFLLWHFLLHSTLHTQCGISYHITCFFFFFEYSDLEGLHQL